MAPYLLSCEPENSFCWVRASFVLQWDGAQISNPMEFQTSLAVRKKPKRCTASRRSSWHHSSKPCTAELKANRQVVAEGHAAPSPNKLSGQRRQRLWEGDVHKSGLKGRQPACRNLGLTSQQFALDDTADSAASSGGYCSNRLVNSAPLFATSPIVEPIYHAG